VEGRSAASRTLLTCAGVGITLRASARLSHGVDADINAASNPGSDVGGLCHYCHNRGETAMSPVVTFLSEDDIKSRRDELLASVAMSYEELSARAADFLLDAEERAVFRRLKDLDYLAADTSS